MRNDASRTFDVFLSHSSKDKKWADAACAVLERHRVRCWIAPRDIIPGDEWGAAVINGINLAPREHGMGWRSRCVEANSAS